MTTDQKGAIAETAIIHAAAKLGIGVFKPLTDGERYDLILDLRPKLIRVQCKWAVRHGDVVAVRLYSCRRTSDGLVKRTYSADEIDAFAAFCADVDRCYFFPIDEFGGRSGVQLRFGPARNNQKLGVRMAKDYEFEATLGSSGAIAQLGERQRGTLEAAGSSPAGSIANRPVRVGPVGLVDVDIANPGIDQAAGLPRPHVRLPSSRFPA